MTTHMVLGHVHCIRTGCAARVTARVQAGALLSAVLLMAGGCGGGPPESVRRYNRIGLQRYHAGQYYEAIGAFQVAREHDRQTPEPSCYMGMCYLALADRNFNEDNLVTAVRYCDRAIRQFNDAYSAFPGYTKALQGKADALKRKGEYQAAIDLADWAVATCGPRSNLLMLAAREYAANGDIDKALTQLHQAAAAVYDPRSLDRPLEAADVAGLGIELSILSSLVRTDDPLSLQVGVHGIYIRGGKRSGCFLPQVALEAGWNAEAFLSRCCEMKMHLDHDTWRAAGTEVYLFTTEHISSDA